MLGYTSFAMATTYLIVVALYLSEPKRFACVFKKEAYPLKLYWPIKLLSYLLLLSAATLWTVDHYGVEVGITRWLAAVTLCGFVAIFLAPTNPIAFKTSLIMAIITCGVSIVF